MSPNTASDVPEPRPSVNAIGWILVLGPSVSATAFVADRMSLAVAALVSVGTTVVATAGLIAISRSKTWSSTDISRYDATVRDFVFMVKLLLAALAVFCSVYGYKFVR